MGKSKYSKEFKEQLVEEYNAGSSSVQLAEKYNMRASYVNQLLRKQGCKIRSNKENSRKYTVNENYFENIDNPCKAYWLGLIYADGYISVRKDGSKYFGLALAKKDKAILERLKNDLDATYPIKTYISTGYAETEYCKLLIRSDKIVNDLIKHGVVEHKTNILQPPVLDDDLISHFIRGYMDGDGCISISNRSNGNTEFSIKILGTENILDFMKAFIENNNIAKINRYYKRQSYQTVSALEMSGNLQVLKFLNLLYKDATVYLERKYNRYKLLCERYSQA